MAAAADDAKLIHALNVLRRMPPSDVAKDLERLAALLPEEADDLREKVDQPLKTAVCTATGRPFLLCDYNRDGDSFRCVLRVARIRAAASPRPRRGGRDPRGLARRARSADRGADKIRGVLLRDPLASRPRRSPWSNTYQPAPEPSDDGEEPFVPTGSIRDLEVAANELFDTYRGLCVARPTPPRPSGRSVCEQAINRSGRGRARRTAAFLPHPSRARSRRYYGASTGLSSVYMWDSGDGVAACWVLKKEIPEASGGRFVKSAAWDAVHVVDAQPTGKGSEWVYRLTTTVLLSLTVEREAVGHVRIAGSLNRQAEKKVAAPDHVATMGSMIEDMESDMRERMEALYIAKTKDAMNATHKRTTGPVQSEAFTSSLTAAVMAKGAERKSKGFD